MGGFITATILKYVSGGLLFVCLLLGLALHMERRHSAKLQDQVSKLNAELHRISSAKNEQKVVTQERIKVVTRTIHEADKAAKVIEQAPLPGNCKTPKEVLDADI